MHKIRLRKYEPNSELQDVRPEGNLQPNDEIVIPLYDLYVITWETNFGDFESGRRNTPYELPNERAGNTSDVADYADQPDQILNDVDVRSVHQTTFD